jgi:soluble lytic murein transglycosylase-like protein
MPPDRIDRAAELLERLVADAHAREQFRARPARELERCGLDDVAAELGDRPLKAMHTLELRESRSSLAGLFLAAAAETVGLMQLIEHAQARGGEAAVAVQRTPTLTAIPTPPQPAAPAPPTAAASPTAPAEPPTPAVTSPAPSDAGPSAASTDGDPVPDADLGTSGPEEEDAGESALPPGPFGTEIAAAAERYGIRPALLRALVRQESSFRPDAVSPAGAQGLCQLMPGTARELGVEDPFDPEQSLDGGARYLKQMLERFDGDERLALAGFNAGPGAVEAAGGVPQNGETPEYVRRVLEYARNDEDAREPGPSEATVARRMLKFARREIGEVEQTENDSPRIAVYRRATDGSAAGQPWCAYFVSWVARKSGHPLGDDEQGFGSVRELWDWALGEDRAVVARRGTVPEPGDLVVFGPNYGGHIGIVEKVLPNGDIQTIEGNYSDKVTRVVRQPDIVAGFVSMSMSSSEERS